MRKKEGGNSLILHIFQNTWYAMVDGDILRNFSGCVTIYGCVNDWIYVFFAGSGVVPPCLFFHK